MTFKITEQDRGNLEADLPRLNELLGRSEGDELDRSKILRAMLRDMHQSIEKGNAPQWLIDYLSAKVDKSKKRTLK